MEAYCVKCKEKRALQEPQATFTASGGPATKGICAVCGTRLFRMGRTEAHAGMEAPLRSAPQRKSKLQGKSKGSSAKRAGSMVIVESPAKARTISSFLGKGFKVHASVGHVRDLLRSQLSVDTEDNFRPRYRVPNEKRQVVKELMQAAGKSESVYLATDPDREGEAIAWHLLEAAEIDPERARRVVFHEITREAIAKAFQDTRAIDMSLVDAQQARRILDRLVGYNLSPLLWNKVRGRLSAGRVQSVALRMVVDRENEIRAFVATEYWTIDAELVRPDHPPAFLARLRSIDGENAVLGSEEAVRPIIEDMRLGEYRVSGLRRGSRTRRPSAPFITSTLQQDASRRLGFSARRTMAVAQQLYEGIEIGEGGAVGLITYMRSDSTHVAVQAVNEARSFIEGAYGRQFLPEKPPTYRTRAKRAQEAHEAIRPTSVLRTPEQMIPFLRPEQQKLYGLVWQRFVASQMSPAEYDTLRVDVTGTSVAHTYDLRISASTVRFEGFLRVYADAKKNGDNNEEENDVALLERLPDLVEGASLELVDLHSEQHFTQPPARYSEASLVRELEEHGIGRPSTYAPILGTLQQRGYVELDRRRLFPTEVGETVNGLLVEHFPNIVDIGFTARMEDQLDEIANGDQNWVEVVRAFYEPFAQQVKRAAELMPEVKTEPEKLDRLCPVDGGQLLIRYGRFGRFVGCANFPSCRHTEPWLEKIGVACPLDGGDLVQRRTRKGRLFYGCANYPQCEFTSWKRPLAVSCPACKGMLVRNSAQDASCQNCGERFAIETLGLQDVDLA